MRISWFDFLISFCFFWNLTSMAWTRHWLWIGQDRVLFAVISLDSRWGMYRVDGCSLFLYFTTFNFFSRSLDPVVDPSGHDAQSRSTLSRNWIERLPSWRSLCAHLVETKPYGVLDTLLLDIKQRAPLWGTAITRTCCIRHMDSLVLHCLLSTLHTPGSVLSRGTVT